MIINRLDNNIGIEGNLKITSNILQKRVLAILSTNTSVQRNILDDAMNYMLLGNGKAIRPFLVFATHYIYNPVITQSVINLATAIEMIHTYTLVHDDLPAMDDDCYRRGRLSCHKKFQESTAILTGDALLTLAFEVLSCVNDHFSDYRIQLRIINGIAKLIGFKGTLLGQVLDLQYKMQQDNLNRLGSIRILKTANLFIAACKFTALINNASANDIDVLTAFAQKLGIAYQIKDDIDDNHHHGSQELLKILVNESLGHLNFFGSKALFLKDLLAYIFKSYC